MPGEKLGGGSPDMPGDAITIEKEIDWVSKTPPYRLIKRFAKKQGWKFAAGRAPDKTGWNVRREE